MEKQRQIGKADVDGNEIKKEKQRRKEDLLDTVEIKFKEGKTLRKHIRQVMRHRGVKRKGKIEERKKERNKRKERKKEIE